MAATAQARRLSRYEKLFQVTRILASELDLEEISHQILRCAIDLIPAAEAGTLYLSDDAIDRLRVQDSVGLGHSIYQLSLRPGECAAGKAFFSGQGAIYNDRVAAVDAMDGASEENLRAFREATQGLRAPKAAMTAPLVFKGDVLGALVVDNLCGGDARFTQDDLQLLTHLAEIAAIGIMNARLFAAEHSTRLRLQVVNDELNRQCEKLDRQLRAMEAMTQVTHEGFSLDAVCARLAALTHGQVVILDGLRRVRAVFPADLDPVPLGRQRDIAELIELVTGDQQRHTRGQDDQQVTVCPVTAEADMLGYIVLASACEPLDALGASLADLAAFIASAAFVSEQAQEDGDVQRRRDLLRRLLDGDIPRAAGLYDDLRPPLRLAVGGIRGVGRRSAAANAQHLRLLRQLKALAADAVQGQLPASAVALHDDHVVIAWPVNGARPTELRQSLFGGIVDALGAGDGWHARFAITQAIDDPQVVPQAYREALLALEIRPWGDDPVIDVGGLGAYRLIIGASSSIDAVESSRKTLHPILEYEKKKGPSLLQTLRAYIALGMSTTAAAKALHIHVHTVQYRLAKVEELSGLSLRNSEERLTLELSLRIHDLALVNSALPKTRD
jgi:hypothetical protein